MFLELTQLASRGERRRQRRARHPQLLLAQTRSAMDAHVSCGRRPLVCGRDSRRYERHELMTHCPLLDGACRHEQYLLCVLSARHMRLGMDDDSGHAYP